MFKAIIHRALLYSCPEVPHHYTAPDGKQQEKSSSGAHVAFVIGCTRQCFYLWSPHLLGCNIDEKLLRFCLAAPTRVFVSTVKLNGGKITNADVIAATKDLAYLRILNLWQCCEVTDDLADYLVERFATGGTTDYITTDSRKITPALHLKILNASHLPREIRRSAIHGLQWSIRNGYDGQEGMTKEEKSALEVRAYQDVLKCLDDRGAGDEFHHSAILALAELLRVNPTGLSFKTHFLPLLHHLEEWVLVSEDDELRDDAVWVFVQWLPEQKFNEASFAEMLDHCSEVFRMMFHDIMQRERPPRLKGELLRHASSCAQKLIAAGRKAEGADTWTNVAKPRLIELGIVPALVSVATLRVEVGKEQEKQQQKDSNDEEGESEQQQQASDQVAAINDDESPQLTFYFKEKDRSILYVRVLDCCRLFWNELFFSGDGVELVRCIVNHELVIPVSKHCEQLWPSSMEHLVSGRMRTNAMIVMSEFFLPDFNSGAMTPTEYYCRLLDFQDLVAASIRTLTRYVAFAIELIEFESEHGLLPRDAVNKDTFETWQVQTCLRALKAIVGAEREVVSSNGGGTAAVVFAPVVRERFPDKHALRSLTHPSPMLQSGVHRIDAAGGLCSYANKLANLL